MVLRRIGILSAAKITGILYGGMGLLFGALFSLMAMAGMMADMSNGGEGALMGMIFGVGAVIFLPLFYGVIGAIFAAIGAALYNLVAGLVGGLEIEIEGIPAASSGSGGSYPQPPSAQVG